MGIAEKQQLGKSGIWVSRAGFGVHPIGPSRKNRPIEEAAEIMCYAYEQGIRFFDTAQFYQTYHYLKAGLDLMRESSSFDELPVISSKSLAEDYAGMKAAIEEACEKLNLETIDIFLMHQMTPGDWEKRAGAWQALKDARNAGKVKAIGISTHHQDLAEQAADVKELDVVFVMYNYSGLGIRRGKEAGSAEGMRQALKKCRAAGKGTYVMKIFGGGNLITDYQKAALHVFRDCRDLIPAAMIGFTSKQEIDELKELLQGEMDPAYNPPTAHMRLRVDREDCMGCGSCVRICASGAMHYSPIDGLAEIDYEKCVSCNYCAIACPERAIVMW